ncbi:DHA2 family efflux MFS transporter permease subunit [Metallibacterium sp.]|uniref:DHA2 family efflux MFS transporter permease subunit n=1 Tax=Metallibacterium sp. TaxID=2940281 RepID=UPI002628ED83|nr:DHA2 family efflux MFS transporter permease subunit [Metallibacterium sp.]
MSAAQDAPPDPYGTPLQGTPLVIMTAAIAFATFMEVLDLTIVNVSVPTIAGALGVSPEEGTWAISSYALASAIMQPLTGWIARRFGEVRTFTTSVLLFVVFSALCGLSTSMPMLVFFRLMQGMVSGPMVPLSLTLLFSIYPREKQGLALGLWAMTVVIAPIFGPVLGGYITDNLHWSWIFLINIPVGLAAGLLTLTLMRGRESKTFKVPIDIVGLVLLAAGVGSLQFMLDNGNNMDWFASPLILTLGLTALVCLSFLIVWELTDRHPVVDLRLFKYRNFTIGVLALTVGMFCFFGINVVYPLWLQTTLGYTAEWAGLATAPVGLLAVVLSPLVGKNLHRMDLRMAVSFAFIVFAWTSFWFAGFSTGSTFWQLVEPRFVQGIAIAFFFIPLNQIIIAGLRPDQIASASGLANFFRTLASSVSTAVTVTLWQHRAEYHHAVLAEHVSLGNPGAVDYIDKVHALGLHGPPGFGLIDTIVNKDAYTLAVNDVFWLFGWLFIVIIPLIWLSRPPFNTAAGTGMQV